MERQRAFDQNNVNVYFYGKKADVPLLNKTQNAPLLDKTHATHADHSREKCTEGDCSTTAA